MSYKISDIEGIGPKFSELLAQEGISKTEHLLDKAGKKNGRKKLAEATGIPEKKILGWTNMADLFRLKGVSSQYAELLHEAGVDSIPELAQRNVENLHKALTRAWEEKKTCKMVPALSQVEKWVVEAQQSERAVFH